MDEASAPGRRRGAGARHDARRDAGAAARRRGRRGAGDRRARRLCDALRRVPPAGDGGPERGLPLAGAELHERVALAPGRRAGPDDPGHHAAGRCGNARPGRRAARRRLHPRRQRRAGRCGAAVARHADADWRRGQRRRGGGRPRPTGPGARQRGRRRRPGAAGGTTPLARAQRPGRGARLRAGHRRHAADPAAGRLADGASHLPGLELQPARPDHPRQREGPAPGVELVDERGRFQSGDAARARRRDVPDQHHEHGAGARRGDRRPHLGAPGRPEPGHRLRRHAEPGHLPGQDLPRHHRRQAGGARRARRPQGVGHGHCRTRQGLLEHLRSDRHRGQGRPGAPGLRPLSRRALHDQRLRRRDRCAGLEVPHHRAQR